MFTPACPLGLLKSVPTILVCASMSLWAECSFKKRMELYLKCSVLKMSVWELEWPDLCTISPPPSHTPEVMGEAETVGVAGGAEWPCCPQKIAQPNPRIACAHHLPYILICGWNTCAIPGLGCGYFLSMTMEWVCLTCCNHTTHLRWEMLTHHAISCAGVCVCELHFPNSVGTSFSCATCF